MGSSLMSYLPCVNTANDAPASLSPQEEALWRPARGESRPWPELTPAFDTPIEYPGIDSFLPYWMGRAIEAIPAP